MKYIRTKDGRIVDCRFSKAEYERDYPNSKVSYDRWFELAFAENSDYEILKQADTIEELCDEFVAMHKTLKATYCIKKTPFENQDENFNIYGAIWNDKGLIYVAKMNDKGELELL